MFIFKKCIQLVRLMEHVIIITEFQETKFDQEIRQICMHLVGLKKASAEEMRKSVYANYASFIR